MFMKERDREKKRAARIARPVPLDDWQQRLNLTDLMPGMNLTGTCISHTAFGAYIDVGSECDGLLHVTQMRLDEFVTHPRQITRPGESINVTIRSINPILKKLHLTLLPWDTVQEQLVTEQYARNRRKGQGRPGDDYNDDEEEDDRIAISDIQVDDELWGELKRVTDFGAYVEVGATVDGFLHFMDHPAFFLEGGNAPQHQRRHPTEFMHRGDRVRVWVSDVDLDQERIKLTAHRPSHLPGPRRFIN